MVSDRVKESLSPACLRHVLSTEGTGWFGPEKLTEVIYTYENSQMYLPGKPTSEMTYTVSGGALKSTQTKPIAW